MRVVSGRTVQRRVLGRRIGEVVHRGGVLADDLATRVDAVGDVGTHAGRSKLEASELSLREQEPALSSARDVEADDRRSGWHPDSCA